MNLKKQFIMDECMNVLQLNCQRAKAVSAELCRALSTIEFEVLALQEPYISAEFASEFTNLGYNAFRPNINNVMVCTLVSKKVEAFHLVEYDSPHCCVVEVRRGPGELRILLINVYCQPSISLTSILNNLEHILIMNRNKPILICTDANSKSPTWFSKKLDDRGREFEEFALLHSLNIINMRSNKFTYEGPAGNSNIDLSLVSDNVVNRVVNWEIKEIVALSDHNPIIININSVSNRDFSNNSRGDRLVLSKLKMNLKRTNWCTFQSLLANERVPEGLEGDDLADWLEHLLHEAIVASNPTAYVRKNGKGRDKSVPWWNNELTRQRAKVKQAKRQLSRRVSQSIPAENEKRYYKSERNTYTSLIKRARWKCFTEYVGRYGSEHGDSLWGKIHKEARSLNIRDDVGSVVRPDGSWTRSWDETITLLFQKFFPRNDNDEPVMVCEERGERTQNQNMGLPLGRGEAERALKSLKNGKATGPDGIAYEHLKALWKCNQNLVLEIVNGLFTLGYFPTKWKCARIKIITKIKDKCTKPTASSYRPIALLSCIGKFFEKLIVERVDRAYKAECLDSKTQFGFKRGLSAEDALDTTLGSIVSTTTNYVLVIFVDIQGAFDNIWWPAVLRRVSGVSCVDSGCARVIESYFSDRIAYVESMNRCERKNVSIVRGCPQGSIIGPYAWRWCMDELLNEAAQKWEENVQWVAYADDIAIVVGEQSRAKLECIANACSKLLIQWCKRYKLTVSSSKTKYMFMKGKPDERRMLKIFVGTNRIERVHEYKYLGIILDDKMTFLAHVKYLRTKVTNYLMSLRRHVGTVWGLKRGVIEILYERVCIPRLAYGCKSWLDLSSRTLIRRQMLAIQRIMLLASTRACKLSATSALQVISGHMPLDLWLIKRLIKQNLRKSDSSVVRGLRYESNLSELERLERDLLNEWQECWLNEKHGRLTYKFLPRVSHRTEKHWFRPGRLSVYVLSGYGILRAAAHARHADRSDKCPFCVSDAETVEHFLFRCPRYELIRPVWWNDCVNEWHKLIENENVYERFSKFVEEAFAVREGST